jgi:4-hydroxy-tetrahydrodipicolinate synthase
MPRIDGKLGKVLLPMVTPFGKDQQVDHGVAAQLAAWLIDRGYCDTLIVGGTTGEFYAMTYDERLALFKTIKKAVGDRVPLVAGTGAASTLHAVSMTQAAASLGYDMAMVVAPFYSKATQKEILHHFKQVAAAVKIPIMVYNIPLFTGVNVDPPTLEELAKVDNIVAVKEEAGVNPTQTSDFVLRVGEDFAVYCGDDTMVLPAMAQGAVGVVSGGSHAVGDLMKNMIGLFLSGKLREATELHLKLYRFFKALSGKGRTNPVPLVRAAVGLVWKDVGPPRAPLLPADEEEVAALAAVLRDLGKLPGGS